MKALLLCAGLGTRLRPLTNTTPKCLVKIGGIPLLEIWLSLLLQNGVTEVLINTHHLADEVNAFVRSSKWTKFIKVTFEKELLGTAATIAENASFFDASPCMVIHADNLSIFRVKDFIKAHNERPKCAEITMMIFDTEHPRECGIVAIDSNNIIREFYEKIDNPPGILANGAVYIFQHSVVEFISKNKNITDISTHVIPHYLGKINTFKNNIFHIDIGTPKTYKSGNKVFLDNKEQYEKIIGLGS